MGVLKRDWFYHATRRPKITSGFNTIYGGEIRQNPSAKFSQGLAGFWRHLWRPSRILLLTRLKINISRITRCMRTLAPIKGSAHVVLHVCKHSWCSGSMVDRTIYEYSSVIHISIIVSNSQIVHSDCQWLFSCWKCVWRHTIGEPRVNADAFTLGSHGF